MPKSLAIMAAALALVGCQTAQGSACDIHYTGPPPAHYVAAGWALNPIVVELPSDLVLETCWNETPVGCAKSALGKPYIIVTDEPERWGLTRQQIEDHEAAHWGGWNRCHNN